MFPRPAPAGQGRSVRKAVDVSTHRRAWHKRAGVVVALMIGALLAAPATPAFAAEVAVSPDSVNVDAGSDATVTVRITPSVDDKSGEISLTGLPSGVTCSSGCGSFQFTGPPLSPKTQLLTLKANDNARDASATVTVRVQPDGSDPDTATFRLTVKAQAPPTTQAPQTVRSISGKVVDQGGDAVAGAYVLLKDSAGKQRDTTTNGDGNFRFTGSSDNPIAPGRIDIGASAENKNAVASFTANAGQSITGRRITLPIAASESPSASPSASESAVPTEDPFEDELGEDEETATESVAAQAPTSNEDSGGFGNWLLILLGGLFVAVGVGTIVLLWMKRKENEDGEPDGDLPAGAPAGAVPAARGPFVGADDQTRVVNRVGAAPDPTMVGGPGLANAPTMMHQPVIDDVPPDPYGAPPQPYGAASGPGGWSGGGGYGDEPGGYGAAGYGNAPSSGGGYGNAPSSGSGYGNSPSSGSGYGSRDYGAGNAGPEYPPAGGGYGERYDEPTGRYQGEETAYPAPADPYATGMYQPDAGGQGYGQSESGGYGRSGAGGDYGRNEPTGGYGHSDPTRGYRHGESGGYGQSDATRGYGEGEPGGGYGQADPNRGYAPGQSDGGYGASPNGGYDQPAGGYGQDAGHQRGGYDNTSYDSAYDQGGYGGGSYGQEAPSRGGYDHGGYGGGQASGGYGQEPPRQRGGYDEGYDQGGYGQSGGYGDPAQAGRGRPDGAPQDRGGRRLDWLDD
ncbi:carboxypeptidase-like regulatory domain-containing protein [Micromonospora sp. C95]|uniref:carboxypeptidase-like regulatory domain-containing protein n=1 Tax=Micromonospora sp. C95 TaxID=2824882 RepID=UPI001B36A241|nr:carboxypeptidase-like regulatory domain-containing protein [Micromonospora sp. C95]MBQ1027449.1 carboxypeptidase regulatory-like domain-containing protein [Micromonospora sp. C95]